MSAASQETYDVHTGMYCGAGFHLVKGTWVKLSPPPYQKSLIFFLQKKSWALYTLNPTPLKLNKTVNKSDWDNYNHVLSK